MVIDNGQNAAPCWCIAFAESALGSVGFYVGQQSVFPGVVCTMSLEWIQFLSKNNLLTVTYFTTFCKLEQNCELE